MSGKFYAGIDNGISGAIAIIAPDGSVEVRKTPTIQIGTKGKFINDIALRGLLLPGGRSALDVTCVFEWAQKQPKFGTKTNWAQGFHCGTVLTTLRQNGINAMAVDPKEWQKEMLHGFRHLGDTKQMSIAACHQIHPKVSLIAPGCWKEHDGIADALLMATWGKRHEL